MMFEVRLTTYGNDADNWVAFDNKKDAVQYLLKNLHDVGFTVGGYNYDDKFEECVWIDKAREVA